MASHYRLQVIADRLVEHFVSAGLMVREWDRVKLHGTVMNTLFRKDSTGKDINTHMQPDSHKGIVEKLLNCWDRIDCCRPVNVCQFPLISFGLECSCSDDKAESWPILTTKLCREESGRQFSVWPQFCLRTLSCMFSKYSDKSFIHFGHGSSPGAVLKFVLGLPGTQHRDCATADHVYRLVDKPY